MQKVALEKLALKEVKYNCVSIREAFGIIRDGLPIVDVDLGPGRKTERKKDLVDGIADLLGQTLGIKKEAIYCIFREIPTHNHYTGG